MNAATKLGLGVAAVALLAAWGLAHWFAAKPAATLIPAVLNGFCMAAVKGDEAGAMAALQALDFAPLETGVNPRTATSEGGWVELARFPGEPQSHGCLMRLSPDQKRDAVLPLLTAFAQSNKMNAAPAPEDISQGDSVSHFMATYPQGSLHLLYRDRPDMTVDPKDPQADVADTVMLFVDNEAGR